jgi:hypothetical protein
MKNASLINAMKFNVNYFTQSVVLMYRVSEINQRSITFDEHVIMWLETNRELRQIRHIVFNKSSTFNTLTFRKKQTSQALSVKELIIFLASTNVSIAIMFNENFINLSSIMTAIKNQSLKAHEIRKICENWKLCFYCKQQYSSKSIIDCSNKKSSLTHLRAVETSFVVFSFDDQRKV